MRASEAEYLVGAPLRQAPVERREEKGMRVGVGGEEGSTMVERLSTAERDRAPEDRLLLRFEDVWVNFGAVQALRGVSLELKAGEIHAVVGENGAGKSTLMAVAAGEVSPQRGKVEVNGVDVTASNSPSRARGLGLLLVHQRPTVLPDLTVAENMRVAVARRVRPAWNATPEWARRAVGDWHAGELEPFTRGRELSAEGQSVLEISRALVQVPRVLILDEPTENLSAQVVPELFEAIRALACSGSGVIYISHRIGEVKAIADRVTVLRDGEVRGTFGAGEVGESDIVRLVAGRRIESVFPPKAEGGSSGGPVLSVSGLQAVEFQDVSLAVHKGEIIGIAGIEGHGQSEVLRGLAGLHPCEGSVEIDGMPVSTRTPSAANTAGILYIPRDRNAEGLMPSLSVRENITTGTINALAKFGVVRARAERQHTRRMIREYGVKTKSMEADVQELSGGNQQKVLVSRAMGAQPRVVLADEPTQGVDVGSRAEIYGFLRERAAQGTGVVVVSSDFRELSGLCDRVSVMSRGRVVGELSGKEVTEEAILEGVLTSSTMRQARRGVSQGRKAGLRRYLRGDLLPPLVLLLVNIAVGIVGTALSSDFLTNIDLSGMFSLGAAIAFAGLAQEIVLIGGGIDLSVGPFMGFLVVLASFVMPDGSGAGGVVLGLVAVVGCAAVVGALNWSFVSVGNVPPMIATLISYTALQGLSLILRPLPAGTIDSGFVSVVSASVSFVPVAAIVAIGLAAAFDFGLVRSSLGLRLRAVGSRSDAAARLGIRVRWVLLISYVGCSLLAAVAALLLMAQVQTGDPTVGTNYTLLSITAVLIGGASIFGGRGSFIGALLGALLIEEIYTLTGIMNLGPAWEELLLGVLVIVAVGVYSSVRVQSEYLRRTFARSRPRRQRDGGDV